MSCGSSAHDDGTQFSGTLPAVRRGVVWVRVRFSEPVSGPDRYADHPTVDDRHELRCDWLRHSDDETLFGVGDEIVEQWPTRRIDVIEWRAEPVADSRGSAGRRPSPQERRLSKRVPRLGERWSPEEDDQLRREHAAGMAVPEIAAAHERNEGGISSRLLRLGLGPEVISSLPPAAPPSSQAD